jgi:hypothetical protein
MLRHLTCFFYKARNCAASIKDGHVKSRTFSAVTAIFAAKVWGCGSLLCVVFETLVGMCIVVRGA